MKAAVVRHDSPRNKKIFPVLILLGKFPAKMNFYGTLSGPQHTLFGRVAPMMEAMRLAVCRAAEQPLPTVQLAHDLPPWVHNIADELTCTIFKEIVNLAPATKKYHARKNGQLVGLFIRLVIFYWKESASQFLAGLKEQ